MTDIGQGLRLLLLILGKARYPREIARPTHGYAATREAAMTAFAKSWRRGIRPPRHWRGRIARNLGFPSHREPDRHRLFFPRSSQPPILGRLQLEIALKPLILFSSMDRGRWLLLVSRTWVAAQSRNRRRCNAGPAPIIADYRASAAACRPLPARSRGRRASRRRGNRMFNTRTARAECARRGCAPDRIASAWRCCDPSGCRPMRPSAPRRDRRRRRPDASPARARRRARARCQAAARRASAAAETG